MAIAEGGGPKLNLPIVTMAENGLPIGELESAGVEVLGRINLGLLPESLPIFLLTLIN